MPVKAGGTRATHPKDAALGTKFTMMYTIPLAIGATSRQMNVGRLAVSRSTKEAQTEKSRAVRKGQVLALERSPDSRSASPKATRAPRSGGRIIRQPISCGDWVRRIGARSGLMPKWGSAPER